MGDNVYHMIHARVQSKDSTNQSIHWTHQYAVLDKVKNNLADPREQVSEDIQELSGCCSASHSTPMY